VVLAKSFISAKAPASLEINLNSYVIFPSPESCAENI
jgi:hypothetical protein